MKEKNELEKKLLLGMRKESRAEDLEKENIYLKENLIFFEDQKNTLDEKLVQMEKVNFTNKFNRNTLK